jgi:hypothetical protein
MPSGSRRALLVAALGFSVAAPRISHPALGTLRAWLSGWRGVGLIAAGMARQGYDLSLTRYDDLGWRATFYVAGREHSPTGATASAFEATPFGAVQSAAWETLGRA